MLQVLRMEKRGIRTRLRTLSRPAAIAALMFLLMRVKPADQTAPLAAALFAAGLAAGENPAALVLGSILGMLRFPLQNGALFPPAGCAAVLLGEILCSMISFLKDVRAETRCCALAGFGTMLPALIHAEGSPLPSLQAAGCAVLAAVCAPFILSALRLRGGRKRLMFSEKTGAAVLLLSVIAALNTLLPFAAQWVSGLTVLILHPLGAGVGALCGLAAAAGGADPLRAAVLCIFGFAAGLKLWQENWQRSIAAAVSGALMLLSFGRDAVLLSALIAAACVYPLLPSGMLRRLTALLPDPRETVFDPDSIARDVTCEAGRRLRALGDAFGEMAQGCGEPVDVPEEHELICEMRSRLCSGCGAYGECWAGGENRAVRFLCQLITDALDAPPDSGLIFGGGEIPPDVMRICKRGRMIPDRLGFLLRDFAEKRRSEIKRCDTEQLLAAQFLQAREILYDLADAQNRPLRCGERSRREIGAALEAQGLSNCEVSAFGTGGMQLSIRRGGGWSRGEARRAQAAVAGAVHGSFSSEARGDMLIFRQKARFQAETGAACQSGIAGEISGDSHMIRRLPGERIALMLSDGMGSGAAASGESAETLRLLWQFLDAGITRKLALETVNRQMLMRSGDELFATVDLCVVDMNTGVAEFSKLAACRSLILREGELLRIEGGRLPLGILQSVQPAVSRIRLKDGDVIIMGSDGVMEAGDSPMIDRAARSGGALPAQLLCENLVREAALRRSRGRSDDMTCICMRVSAVKKKRQALPVLANDA